jgi:hypothetical protein
MSLQGVADPHENLRRRVFIYAELRDLVLDSDREERIDLSGSLMKQAR